MNLLEQPHTDTEGNLKGLRHNFSLQKGEVSNAVTNQTTIALLSNRKLFYAEKLIRSFFKSYVLVFTISSHNQRRK